MPRAAIEGAGRETRLSLTMGHDRETDLFAERGQTMGVDTTGALACARIHKYTIPLPYNRQEIRRPRGAYHSKRLGPVYGIPRGVVVSQFPVYYMVTV
jgi:hypothetical protein